MTPADKPMLPVNGGAKPLADMSVEELAKSIKEKVSLVLSTFQRSVNHAMEVGDLLIEVKRRVGHGNFEAWVATHCQLSGLHPFARSGLYEQHP